MVSQSKHDLAVVVDWLKEHFPKAFPRSQKLIRPLQLGVMDDILEFYDRLDYPPFSRKKLRAGINYYTSSKAYLKAQVAGSMRLSAFGEEIEPVTTEQAQYAKEKLASRYANKNAEQSNQTIDGESVAEEEQSPPLDESSKAS